MFEFLLDSGNYDTRKVGRYDDGDKMVSTARVSDGLRPYETAFAHPAFNDGKMVIVEAYGSLKEAKAGHAKWVATMTGELPSELVDCQNSKLAAFVGGEMRYARTKS